MASRLTQARCSSCRRDTKHKLLREKSISQSKHDERYELEFGEPMSWTDVYEILQCQVCDEVGFRQRTWYNPTEEWSAVEYPPPKPKGTPPWIASLPPKLRDLALEMYRAIEADSRRL